MSKYVPYDPPEADADSSDSQEFQFKIPKTRVPEPIMPGVKGWRTTDGYLVLRLHYSADPLADEEWKQERVKGYRGGFEGSDWQREMEIDFGSYSGMPVYQQFEPTKSVKPVRYSPHLPLWRGWDFGYRNPAVTFCQLWPDDTLVFLHEMFPTKNKEKLAGISTGDLCKLVLQETTRLFPNASDVNLSAGVYDFCDPSGVQKKETSDFSSIEIMQQYGIDPEWNVVGRKNRIEYARVYVEAKHEDGTPRFLVNPHCTLAIEGFSAAYRYPEESSGSADREMPDLSRKIQEEPYIHIIDSFEYIVSCNLEITYPSHTGMDKGKDDNSQVTDLASAYLGTTSGAPSRVASVPLANAAGPEDLESTIQELIGIDDLSDAWSLT
jgi:hypothetical protein